MDATAEALFENLQSHNNIEFQPEMIARCSRKPGTMNDSHYGKCELAGTHDGPIIRVVSSEYGLPHIPNYAGAPFLNRLVLFMVIYLRLPS